MNKADLIIALANETDLTKSEAEAVVNLFFNEMTNALTKGPFQLMILSMQRTRG